MKRFQAFVVVCAGLALASCGGTGSPPTGPEEHDSRSVDLDKAERVRAELKMNSGELNVRGGAKKLLNADFSYNISSWKPDVRYSDGNLTVEQPGSTSSGIGAKNRWDLRLNDGVPLDLTIDCGAGEARLDFGSLNLRDLHIAMGAGTVRLDLRGKPAQGYSAEIRGGVGEATVYLPRGADISAKVTGGLGDVSVTGLHKRGDIYVSEGTESSGVKIRLDVQGGIGSIKLIAE